MITSTSLQALAGGDYQDLLIRFDHRDEEESIISALSNQLAVEDHITLVWKDEQLWFRYHEQDYYVPLSFSMHDRYIAISSFAELVKEHYTLFLDKESRKSDTHGLLLLAKADIQLLSASALNTLRDQFIELERGYDYFSGLIVPYIDHLDHNPHLEDEAREQMTSLREHYQALENSPEIQNILTNLRQEIAEVQTESERKARRQSRVLSIILLAVLTSVVIKLM